MAIYYIGSFPPEYGGVTIKNKNLLEALEGTLDIGRVDMNRVKKGNIPEILRLLRAMLPGNRYIIGLAGQRNRRLFTKLLYFYNRRAMKRSVLLVMGGIVSDIIEAGPKMIKKMDAYRSVYVEFPGMAKKLTAAGLHNAAVYPNGRPRPKKLQPIAPSEGTLRCVFFSRIQPEKGVDRILAAAEQLPGVQFDFYGAFEPSYRQTFLSQIEGRGNVCYHGVFVGSTDDVYSELGKYHVLLLPTRCKTEGLPGVLIEAKIAGLASVVSDINYLGELVSDGEEGVLLKEDTPAELIRILERLDGDRQLLQRLRCGSQLSAERYYIDSSIDLILRDFREE